MTESLISLKPIAELLTDENSQPTRFWIPAYQRGYRWKPLQIVQLLDDIWEFVQNSEGSPREAFYCLQPLVIKVQDCGRLEVVDGQQRLTTIYILLTYLKDKMSLLGKSRFEITFETRGEANEPFLSDIDLERSEENVDFFHIAEAYKAINDWFSERDSMHKVKLLQHLLNDDEAGRNVKVIWFQLSDGDIPVDAFTRLNVGKIPLTNDELIRALFLRRQTEGSSGADTLQLKIAYEWDQLEKALQSDPLWYFISNDAPNHNRIGFLFEFVACVGGLPPGAEYDPYGIFYFFNQKIKNLESRPEMLWLKIKQTFMMLEEWFEDRTLFHITGFLIQQGVSIDLLQKMSSECTKSSFDYQLRQEVFRKTIGSGVLTTMSAQELKGAISDRLDELSYRTQGHHAPIRGLLLLFNIATLLDNPRSNLRFQFDRYKKEEWDIEHIRSVADDQPQRRHDRVAWLNHCLCYFKVQKTENALQCEIQAYIDSPELDESDDTFESLYDKVLEVFGEKKEDEADHGVANLTLLDQTTNRGYKNAVFAVKRQQVLSLDQAGIFIPLCTRNVFLKCYSPLVDNVMFWSMKDRSGYRDTIVSTLAKFFDTNEGLVE